MNTRVIEGITTHNDKENVFARRKWRITSHTARQNNHKNSSDKKVGNDTYLLVVGTYTHVYFTKATPTNTSGDPILIVYKRTRHPAKEVLP